MKCKFDWMEGTEGHPDYMKVYDASGLKVGVKLFTELDEIWSRVRVEFEGEPPDFELADWGYKSEGHYSAVRHADLESAEELEALEEWILAHVDDALKDKASQYDVQHLQECIKVYLAYKQKMFDCYRHFAYTHPLKDSE